MAQNSGNAHKNTVTQYFDEHSQSWRDRYDKTDFESVSYQDRMTAALELLASHGQTARFVLDAGCGAGIQALAMSQQGYEVVACDIAPSMARSARRLLGRAAGLRTARVFVADLERSPLREGSFDAIVLLGVIGYSDHPDKVLDALCQALRPGGLLVISTASEHLFLSRLSDLVSYIPDTVYMALKRVFFGRQITINQEDTGFYKANYRYQSARQFDALISEHGFRKLASRAVNFGRTHFMGKRVLPESLDITLSRVLSGMAKLRVAHFLQQYARIYVVCARKSG